MIGAPTSFWGKLRRGEDGRAAEWHPLEDHCADVAACCEALLDRTLLRHRLATFAGLGELTAEHVARLCVLAALHDIGKVNAGFRRKADPAAPQLAGHVRPLFALFASRFRERDQVLDALGVDELLDWGPEGLLLAALAHHGQPVSIEAHGSEADPSLWRSRDGLDPLAWLADHAARLRRWYPAAFGRHAQFPGTPAFQHAFSGLVTLADWLGSDERFFPFAPNAGSDRIGFARQRAREAIESMGLDATVPRGQLELRGDWFHALTGFAPRPAQQAVLELGIPRGGGVAVLESETGSGKTEAAFARFLTLFRTGAVDGLYFALPTRTAATEIHKRIVRSVEIAFPVLASRPPVVLAVPGYVKVDDVVGARGEAKLAPFQALWPDDPRDRMLWRRWAAEGPKKYLAGAVVVGTVDQVLLSALRVKHAHLRATSLSRSLLVVDEVHASDAYMNRVLEVALRRHVAAGGHALLMSATLGSAARRRFLAPSSNPPSLEAAESDPYPAVSQAEGSQVCVSATSGEARQKAVSVELACEAGDPGAIATRALAAARDGARVLVIRNTVSDAIATQLALEAAASEDASVLFAAGGGVFAPHHSRYSREDRQLLDAALESRLGKSARSACVVVATQTVQQSLDLDADLLLSDLCPMDVLLQRVGRLHRHERTDRPRGFACARVVVLTPEKELVEFINTRTGEPHGRHGIGAVYRDLRVLQATLALLRAERELMIPARNRHYVERTTHPSVLERVTASGTEQWSAHRRWLSGTLMAELGLATLNASDWGEPFGSTGWAGDGSKIATRLGVGDRIIEFDEPLTTAFGTRTGTLSIPGWMASGVDEDERPSDVAPRPRGGAAFRFGSRAYVYDRLGLRVDRGPSEEECDG